MGTEYVRLNAVSMQVQNLNIDEKSRGKDDEG